VDEGMAFELLAASLRASSSDLESFVKVLAGKLEQALPGRAVVERRPARFLSKQLRVERIECQLGDRRYLLTARRGAVETRCATVVRGIVLKTAELPLDQWIEALARDLASEAQQSEASRLALERLLTQDQTQE
jgi:hypothetical protein